MKINLYYDFYCFMKNYNQSEYFQNIPFLNITLKSNAQPTTKRNLDMYFKNISVGFFLILRNYFCGKKPTKYE